MAHTKVSFGDNYGGLQLGQNFEQMHIPLSKRVLSAILRRWCSLAEMILQRSIPATSAYKPSALLIHMMTGRDPLLEEYCSWVFKDPAFTS